MPLATNKTSLLKKYRVDTITGCWIWLGGCTKDGYGKVSFRDKTVRAHRLMWTFYRGRIPKGRILCHDCPGGDNKLCGNPDHLYLGTVKINGQDASKKQQLAIGEDHGSARCTVALVIWLREKYANGAAIKSLAQETTISETQVHRIVKGRSWKHVKAASA